MAHFFRIFILLLIPLAASAEQELIFTTNPAFAVISTATGKVSRSDPFLTVVLDQYTMRTNTTLKTPRRVLRYKVGLASSNASGQWNVARWSAAVDQSFLLGPGETKLIENMKLVIPIDGLQSLKDYWLVLAVEMDGERVGYAYAHSNKGLF